MKAGYITRSSIEIIPVPRNASYSANPGDTLVSSDAIRDFILAQSVTLPQNVTTSTDTHNNENNNNNNQ